MDERSAIVSRGTAAIAAALLVTIRRIRRDAHPPPPTPGDAIVVFGAAVWGDAPSPELAARIERAAALHRDGYAPVVLCCGDRRECEAMRDALIGLGVPDGAILTDDRATTTRRTLDAVARRGEGRWRRVVLVSSPYHLHRVHAEARRHGIDASTAAATLQPLALPPRSRGEVRLLSWQLRRPVREALASWSYALPVRRSPTEANRTARTAESSAQLAAIVAGAGADGPSAAPPRLVKPVNGTLADHDREGVDFAADRGAAIFAAATGHVLWTGELGPYGRVVALGHDGGYATIYGDLSTVAVDAAERVPAGHLVGTAGATGDASAPRLRFELRRAGEPIDPLPHLAASDLLETA